MFIVCGAAAGAGVGASVSSVLLATALASGFAVTTLTQCFSHISGKLNDWYTRKYLFLKQIRLLCCVYICILLHSENKKENIFLGV